MLFFKALYNLISFLLLTTQACFFSIMIYNKMTIGRILYFGNSDEPNIGYEHYFNILVILLYASFSFMIIWALLTPLAVFSNKRSPNKNKINIHTGILSFLLAIVLLFIDPFGIFKWFTH